MDAKSLNGIPLFAELSKKDREQIARWADEIDEPAGFTLVDQGRFAHEFFVLLQGTVDVRKDDEHLTDLGPGDFFGEIALVEDERRTASVTATTPVRAIVMHSRDFRAMRAQMPAVCARIESAIQQRSGR
ncbi:MAG TPA: cyclic nucleotide-binding domain-containing protein [Actinomycetota bacterium]|nr:cyclic nucleotide-binding domain-containing protein [Actinomycetota bacterium]